MLHTRTCQGPWETARRGVSITQACSQTLHGVVARISAVQRHGHGKTCRLRRWRDARARRPTYERFGLHRAARVAPRAGGGAIPSVFVADLTWTEVRDAIAAGKTTALYYAGSTEQNGPGVALGKHTFVAHYVAQRILKQVAEALHAAASPKGIHVSYIPDLYLTGCEFSG